MTNSKFVFLLSQLQKGNADALKQIYEEYFYRLYCTALGGVHNSQDAYDIAMTVVEKLLNYKSSPQNIINHKSLLSKMTKNAVIDFLRNRKRSVFLYENIEDENSGRDLLWIEDIYRVLTDTEKSVFIDHVIWEKNLKTIAIEKGLSYASIKRVY